MLGEVLAQFYCNGVFDEKTFYALMENDTEGKYVYDYISFLYRRGSVDLKKIIERLKVISNNKNLLMNLISLESIEDYKEASITISV